VNGDGYDDVIVTAPGFLVDHGYGAAFVFQGSASGIGSGGIPAAAARIESDRDRKITGWVAGAGDVNGDGYADVAVSGTDHPNWYHGWYAVFVGGPGGIADAWPGTGAVVNQPPENLTHFGEVLEGGGDLNGDGFDDVIVGARGRRLGARKAFVYHGSSEVGFRPDPADQYNAQLGTSVSAAGDVNGDGFDDVIVAPRTTTRARPTRARRSCSWVDPPGSRIGIRAMQRA
jgi:hypothetical protein